MSLEIFVILLSVIISLLLNWLAMKNLNEGFTIKEVSKLSIFADKKYFTDKGLRLRNLAIVVFVISFLEVLLFALFNR